MYVHIRMCVYIYTIYLYVHIQTHTHTHTYTKPHRCKMAIDGISIRAKHRTPDLTKSI